MDPAKTLTDSVSFQGLHFSPFNVSLFFKSDTSLIQTYFLLPVVVIISIFYLPVLNR